MKCWIVGWVALSCAAQDVLPPDLALLARIKTRVAQNLKQLPDFTCAETIERWVKRSSAKQPELLDTVRLEVAYVGGKELFGPAGGGKIDQASIRKIIRGTVGDGDFATIVKEVLLGPAATFHYEGKSNWQAQPAELFTFHVAQLVSGYRMTTSSGSAAVGFSGRFWADAGSLDLIRVELTADEIPSELRLSAASEWIEYRRVPIGTGAFLLPSHSEMNLVNAEGSGAKNRTSFESCHQFVVASVLSFAEVSPEPAPSAPRSAVPEKGTQLPEEFTVDISLDTAIDSDAVSAGDPVSATLRQSIKVEKTTFAPKGAKLTGRIGRLEQERGEYSMDLAFSSLDWKDGHADLNQRKNEVRMMVTTRVSAPVAGVQGQPSEQVIDTLSPLVFKMKHLKLSRGMHLVLKSHR